HARQAHHAGLSLPDRGAGPVGNRRLRARAAAGDQRHAEGCAGGTEERVEVGMSHHHRTVAVLDNYEMDARLWRKGRNVLAAAALGGWAVLALGYSSASAAFHSAYLVAFVYWLTVALGALFFVMLQHLSGAAWSVTSRRTAETL